MNFLAFFTDYFHIVHSAATAYISFFAPPGLWD